MRRGFLLIWGLATAAIASAAGFFSYQAGWAAAAAAKLPAGAPPHYYYDGPHAYGFGFFGIIPLLFFILLLVLVFRAARWGRGMGGWGPGGGHRGGPGGRSYMEERLQSWHRQAHGEAEPAKAEQPAP